MISLAVSKYQKKFLSDKRSETRFDRGCEALEQWSTSSIVKGRYKRFFLKAPSDRDDVLAVFG